MKVCPQYKLEQRKKVSDEEEASCECGACETATHMLRYCTCRRYVDVRGAFVRKRRAAVSKSGFCDATIKRFCEIHELKSGGTYPDLSSESELWSGVVTELES